MQKFADGKFEYAGNILGVYDKFPVWALLTNF